ncbi:MAG: hypothetical protein Q4E45_11705 [Eubacteriales bacterium]|nr:hypothetical protein [Eubacteriales bacterium]
MKKIWDGGSLWQVLLMPLAVYAVGMLLLWAVSFIPNSVILDHALASAYQLNDEGWPRNFQEVAGHVEFDRATTVDSVSVMTAYTLDREHPENLWLKKVNANPNILGWYRRLVDTVEHGETITVSYSRYCMGFRLPIRLLLVVTAFYGIRFLAAAAEYMLLALAMATTGRRGSGWTAAALAASLGLIEPWAIIGSMGYSTCIILLLLLLIWLNCAKLELSDGRTFRLFCLFGALTQFFDFYTFPLLVFSLPLLALIQRYRGRHVLKHAARLSAGWLVSWVVTWLINMAAVSLFTEDRGIRDALTSAAYRLGVSGYRDTATSYSVAEAFRSVWAYLRLPSAGVLIPVLLALLAGLYLYARLRWGRNGKLAAYLAVGSLGPVWIAVTAQPVIIHTSMQYRSLCTLFFALMLYTLEALGILNGKSRLAGWFWKE